jgi:hypothetical protein
MRSMLSIDVTGKDACLQAKDVSRGSKELSAATSMRAFD